MSCVRMLGWRGGRCWVEPIMRVKYQTLVYALTFFIASCSDPLMDVRKAAVALQATEKQGLTLADFQHLTQQLALKLTQPPPTLKTEYHPRDCLTIGWPCLMTRWPQGIGRTLWTMAECSAGSISTLRE
jgi:hypothetical protein